MATKSSSGLMEALKMLAVMPAAGAGIGGLIGAARAEKGKRLRTALGDAGVGGLAGLGFGLGGLSGGAAGMALGSKTHPAELQQYANDQNSAALGGLGAGLGAVGAGMLGQKLRKEMEEEYDNNNPLSAMTKINKDLTMKKRAGDFDGPVTLDVLKDTAKGILPWAVPRAAAIGAAGGGIYGGLTGKGALRGALRGGAIGAGVGAGAPLGAGLGMSVTEDTGLADAMFGRGHEMFGHMGDHMFTTMPVGAAAGGVAGGVAGNALYNKLEQMYDARRGTKNKSDKNKNNMKKAAGIEDALFKNPFVPRSAPGTLPSAGGIPANLPAWALTGGGVGSLIGALRAEKGKRLQGALRGGAVGVGAGTLGAFGANAAAGMGDTETAYHGMPHTEFSAPARTAVVASPYLAGGLGAGLGGVMMDRAITHGEETAKKHEEANKSKPKKDKDMKKTEEKSAASTFGEKVAINFDMKNIDWKSIMNTGLGGAALGAGLGGLAGLIAPGEDGQGRRRGRISGALRGALGGGLLGGGAAAIGEAASPGFGRSAYNYAQDLHRQLFGRPNPAAGGQPVPTATTPMPGGKQLRAHPGVKSLDQIRAEREQFLNPAQPGSELTLPGMN